MFYPATFRRSTLAVLPNTISDFFLFTWVWNKFYLTGFESRKISGDVQHFISMSGSSFSTYWPFITQHVVQTTRQQEVEAKNGMRWKGGEAQTWDEGRNEAADDLWWSISRDTKGWLKPQPCPIFTQSDSMLHMFRHCVHSCTIRQYNWGIKSLRCRHMQEEKGKKRLAKQLITNCLPVICFASFWMSQIRKTFNRKTSLSLSLFSLPSCLFSYSTLSLCWDCIKIQFSNSKSLLSGNLLWYPNMAVLLLHASMCPTFCVNSVRRKNLNAESWSRGGSLLWLPLEDVQKSCALTPDVLVLLLSVLIYPKDMCLSKWIFSVCFQGFAEAFKFKGAGQNMKWAHHQLKFTEMQ